MSDTWVRRVSEHLRTGNVFPLDRCFLEMLVRKGSNALDASEERMVVEYGNKLTGAAAWKETGSTPSFLKNLISGEPELKDLFGKVFEK